MTIEIELTEFARKIVVERLKNSKKKDVILVITEFERLNWCSGMRAQWTSVHFEDSSRVDELELLGTVDGLRIFADAEAAYFLLMAKKLLLDGKRENERSFLVLADIE